MAESLPARRCVAGLACVVLCGLIGGVAGCSGAPAKLNAVEKAKLVKELHEEADRQFDLVRITENEPEGINEKALFEYARLWGQITEIMGPSDYPLAYANHAGALTRVGMYYQTLALLNEKELETAGASEKASIEAKVKKFNAEAMKSFAKSNRQFDLYFQGPGVNPDPATYKWAVGNSVNLKDWRRAIDYLDRLEASGGLSELGKKEVAQLRREYEENLRRKDEKELENELNRDRGGAETRSRTETAN